MKNKLFYLFLTISSIGISQTLEHSYISDGKDYNHRNHAFLTENNLYYLTLDATNNQILIYDSTHSLYKTVIVTLPSSFEIDLLLFASDKLFNLDSKIEILIVTRNSSDESKMLLFNEDGGDNIFDFGDKRTANVFKDLDNNFKMMTSINNSSSNYLISYDIYSLSGTLTVSQESFLNKQKIISFPNPSSSSINITNPLKNNENEKIEVYDINGRKVLEKKITGNGENIKLDISKLSKGIYNYRVRQFGNKFVKE
jgi:hypothetical protein